MTQQESFEWIGEHQACDWDYLDWKKVEPAFLNEDIKAQVPEMCTTCLLLDACRVRVSFLLHYNTEMDSQTYAEIAQGILDSEQNEYPIQ